MEYYRIKNLERYQDLKKTKSYAKIYFTILMDDKFEQLTDSQRWLYIGMILMACQNDNKLSTDVSLLYKKLCHSPRRGGGSGTRAVSLGVKRLLELGLIYRYIYKYIDKDDLNKLNETTSKGKEECREFLKKKGILKSKSPQ